MLIGAAPPEGAVKFTDTVPTNAVPVPSNAVIPVIVGCPGVVVKELREESVLPLILAALITTLYVVLAVNPVNEIEVAPDAIVLSLCDTLKSVVTIAVVVPVYNVYV